MKTLVEKEIYRSLYILLGNKTRKIGDKKTTFIHEHINCFLTSGLLSAFHYQRYSAFEILKFPGNFSCNSNMAAFIFH